eukprot:30294-Pelagococcus_subviridis.AAC.77
MSRRFRTKHRSVKFAVSVNCLAACASFTTFEALRPAASAAGPRDGNIVMSMSCGAPSYVKTIAS